MTCSGPQSTGATAEPGRRPLLVSADWLLRAAVLSHAIAMFAMVFSTRQTHFGNLLFMNWLSGAEDPYVLAVCVEKVTVSLYLTAGVITVFKPCWPILLLLTGYAFLEALAGTLNGGYHFSEWTIPAYALRFGVPFVLLVLRLELRGRRPLVMPSAAALLRVLIALVFLAHGYQALLANPRYIDLIIGSFRHVLNVRVTEAAAVTMAWWIAVVDGVVALAVLFYPVPLWLAQARWSQRVCPGRAYRVSVAVVMLWLAFWGFVTALSRMTALGVQEGLPEYLELIVRSAHTLGPLALWYLAMADPRLTTCPPGR